MPRVEPVRDDVGTNNPRGWGGALSWTCYEVGRAPRCTVFSERPADQLAPGEPVRGFVSSHAGLTYWEADGDALFLAGEVPVYAEKFLRSFLRGDAA